MIKNKLFKFTIIFTCLFLLISPFSVFADEIDETLTDDDQQQEQTEQSDYVPESNTSLIDTSDYATSEDIADLQNQINDTNDNFESLLPLLSTSNLPVGAFGKIFNFDNLTSYQLNYYYDNYDSLNVVNMFDSFVLFTFNSDFVRYEGDYNNYRYYFNRAYKINNSDSTELISADYWYVNLQNQSPDPTDRGIFKVLGDNYHESYILTPYKLSISNNGTGSYTNSITSEPYISTNIYYNGQTISLTYNDTNNDFTGWYDNNGNLLNNNTTYTFNITSDTNLVINYDFEIQNNNISKLSILLLTMILFIFFMGGKVYD